MCQGFRRRYRLIPDPGIRADCHESPWYSQSQRVPVVMRSKGPAGPDLIKTSCVHKYSLYNIMSNELYIETNEHVMQGKKNAEKPVDNAEGDP
jgi:hypothetical protein